jgi:fucose permease
MQKSESINYFIILILSYLAFISLGLPDSLLGIAWPFMSEKFQVPLDSLGILLIAFVIGYLATSTTSAKIVSIIPLGVLLATSCAMTGLSLFAFALSGHWLLVIIASFFLGSGGGAIDSSINTFAASKFSASVVNWLHAFYGVGATLGPLIMGLIMSQNKQWCDGYMTVGTIQIVLACLFLLTLKYWNKPSETVVENQTQSSFAQVIRQPVVWINIFLFFLYTGLEIAVGQWVFSLFTLSRNISAEQASFWTGIYWGSLTVGRIFSGFVLTKIESKKVLQFAMAGILLGTVLLAINQSYIFGLIGLMLIGLFNAPVFPILISLTPERVGTAQAGQAIGLQISAAMIGGALISGLAGVLADYIGLEIIPKLFIVIATLLVILYVISGRKGLKKT